jgi:D-aminoacyl-tRNA deacylase
VKSASVPVPNATFPPRWLTAAKRPASTRSTVTWRCVVIRSACHYVVGIAVVRAVVQRVTEAAVTIDGSEVVGVIGPGLCVLVGVTHDDTTTDAEWIARKVWHMRVFDDEAGVMNRSASDLGAEVLVVSQFTLYGDATAGRRPSWIAAARPDRAEPLVEHVVTTLRDLGASVATGRFRAVMQVSLVNDGPVTVLLDSPSTTSPPTR